MKTRWYQVLTLIVVHSETRHLLDPQQFALGTKRYRKRVRMPVAGLGWEKHFVLVITIQIYYDSRDLDLGPNKSTAIFCKDNGK